MKLTCPSLAEIDTSAKEVGRPYPQTLEARTGSPGAWRPNTDPGVDSPQNDKDTKYWGWLQRATPPRTSAIDSALVRALYGPWPHVRPNLAPA
jgi:hypothetical protein